ncbi:hypothetical protein ACIHFE_04540 [Streptomyces sp. NPDC052396]|uniref:hypothetical protein n=1 Tax=Streptomyces sp. NPDC052396 TaxID=3365689 RepID=UPI0037D1CE99
MSRRLKMLGTTSDDNDCPTLYEDLDTGEILVQGETADDEDVAQLRAVKPTESFVIVPRELLVRFAPKE